MTRLAYVDFPFSFRAALDASLSSLQNFFQHIPKNSQLFKLAESALISQLTAYKSSQLVSSVKHLKLEEEIVNFCLRQAPALPKLLKKLEVKVEKVEKLEKVEKVKKVEKVEKVEMK